MARASCTCPDACRDRLPAVAVKTFSTSSAHAYPQSCVSGKRPVGQYIKKFNKASYISAFVIYWRIAYWVSFVYIDELFWSRFVCSPSWAGWMKIVAYVTQIIIENQHPINYILQNTACWPDVFFCQFRSHWILFCYAIPDWVCSAIFVTIINVFTNDIWLYDVS